MLSTPTRATVSVDVLIGADRSRSLLVLDHDWSFFTGGIIKGDPTGPVALETKLGWVLSGPAACPTSTESCTVKLSSTHVLKMESAETSDMKGDLQKFWDLETLGIKENENEERPVLRVRNRFTLGGRTVAA